MVSCMDVSDECKLKFLELTAKRNCRFIIFKIENQEVVVEKLGIPDEAYEAFTASQPAVSAAMLSLILISSLIRVSRKSFFFHCMVI